MTAMSAQHGLTAITKPGALTAATLSTPRNWFTTKAASASFSTFGNDQQRLAIGGHFVEKRKQVGKIRDLFLVNQNASVFENALCSLGVRHEVWGEPALVEAHAFHKVQSGLEALGFLDFNHAVCTNSVNGSSDHATQFTIVVGGNRGHLLKIIHLLAWLGEFVHSAGHFGGGHHTTLDGKMAFAPVATCLSPCSK